MNSQESKKWRRAEILALLLITGVAALLRFDGVTYGLGNLNVRSDEEFLIREALGFFSGDLHPGLFYYPTLIPYLLAGLYAVMNLLFATGFSLESLAVNPALATLTARIVLGLFGILSVPALWVIGRRFFSARVGAWAGIFLAVCYLVVREGHFAKLTTPALFWFTILLGVSFWLLNRRDAKSHLIAGLLLGLGVSTFYTVIFAGCGLIAAVLYREGKKGLVGRNSFLFVASAVVGFFLATPYALLDATGFIESFLVYRYQHMYVGLGQDVLIGSRWYGWVYHLIFTLRYGVGIPLLLTGIASSIFLFLSAVKKKDGRAWVLLAMILPYYLFFGAATDRYVRYMVPILPALFLATAWFLDRLFPMERFVSRLCASIVVFLLCVTPLAESVEFNWLLNQPDARIIGAQWINQNLPEGSTIFMYPSRGNPEPDPARFSLIRTAFTTPDELFAADPM